MARTSRFRRFLQTSLAAALAVGGVLLDAIQPRPSHSAEDIRITTTGPLVLTVSVDDLATFAETGEITPDLRLYAALLNDAVLGQLQKGLSLQLPLNVVTVDNVAYSPLGRDVLFNLGKVVQTTPGQNGQTALRAAVINAAANADPEGWTLIDALRAFPAQSIHIDLMDLLALRRELALYFSYNQAANAAIQSQAAAEALTQADLNVAGLPDLSQPGPYAFQKDTITVTNPATRQTIDAFVGDGILTYAALRLAGKPLEEFALIPELPLTCEFYGLVLPDNDPPWRTMVNQYLVSDSENAISTEWFADLYPETLNQADFCLNR